MLKIAYLTNGSVHSGVGFRAQKIADELKREYGSDLRLTEYHLDGEKHELYKDGQLIVSLKPWPGLFKAKTFGWIRLGWKLGRMGLDEHDIIHATNQTLSFVPTKKPLIVTVHDLIELIEPQTGVSRILAQYLYRGIKKAAHIITVSHYTAQTVQKTLNISAEKISVVYNGVDSDFHPITNFRQSIGFKQWLKRLNISPSHKVILYLGSDHPRKNVVILLRAFAQVLQSEPNVVLLKVGSAGLRAGRVAALDEIQKLGIRDSVRMMESVPTSELNELFNLADVFVFPSRFEGFGLPPLQAMAAGTPVITSNATSLPEVVGEAGIMHDPDDVEGFAKSIVRVLHDQQFSDELREAGLKQAERFSWKEAVDGEHAVYIKVKGL